VGGGDLAEPDGTAGPPPASERLVEVGRVARPHGLRGEVVVERWSDLDERLAPGAELRTDGATLVVTASRPHGGRHLVRFAGVDDVAAAEALRGVVLTAPAKEVPGTLWIHDLVGVEVRDTDGRVLGTVEAVEPNPASDLLVLEGGGLIPLRFVVDFEPGRRVTVEIPDGLLE